MGYVVVTGGGEAIEQAERTVRYYRLKDSEESVDVGTVIRQFRLLVDRTMSESGLYAPGCAALALKQAEGEPYEAAFLLRAYRSTLARDHTTLPLVTGRMRIIRRISSTFRDIPGGQILGPTRDYTHRLLDFTLLEEGKEEVAAFLRDFLEPLGLPETPLSFGKVIEQLRREGLVATPSAEEGEEPFDITRETVPIPAPRSARLQTLARGETGAVVALAYSHLRGAGNSHPTIGELRVGYVPVSISHPYAADDETEAIYIGEMLVTEVETVDSFRKDDAAGSVLLEIGYGLCFGHNEQKAMAMAVLGRTVERRGTEPAEDEQFVMNHIDLTDSGGVMTHLTLPHYATFQAMLDRLTRLRDQKEQPAESEVVVHE